jgi:hypothetical protein
MLDEHEGGKLYATYAYLEGEDAPVVPENITYGDFAAAYELIDTTSPALDATYVKPVKTEVKVITHTIAIPDKGKVASMFPATQNIDDGEFIGDIALDGENPFTFVTNYGTQTDAIDRAVSLHGLPTNEVSQIAPSKTYTVRSDAALGATRESDFALARTWFYPETTGDAGRPLTWVCEATYRGQESYLVPTSYSVTANYKGVLTSNRDRYSLNATYAPVSFESEPVPLAETSASPLPYLDPGVLTATGAISAVITSALIATVCVIVSRRRRDRRRATWLRV